MRILRTLTAALLTVTLSGCAGLRSNMRRHPLVYGAIIGGGIGLGVAEATKRGTCPSIINGYPYSGTPPCPPPNYDPGSHKR